MRVTRRESLGFLQASSAPLQELVNAFEFETAAQHKLDAGTFQEIAGGERAEFERITFRPRLMVNTTKLDLTLELFGQSMFAPIIVGPMAEQKRFHPEGEVAMARGASAAKTAMVISSRCSCPVDQIAAQAKTALWFQVFPEPDMIERVQEAVKAGCKAICLTLGAGKDARVDWSAIDRLRKAVAAPLVLKGILHPDEARSVVQRGVQGIVVSNYTGRSGSVAASPMEMLPSIVEAVGGKVPVLIDGGFRRGSDVLKALALGARAVLLGRPVLWGLTAYGVEGVQRLLELMQTELARDMAMCGRANLRSIDRSMVKVHGG